ncbi:MAG TPA: xanthine dehydrogenase family protein molybdopterin-binding subunit [Syntrophorhabdales bacterium]|nr:xanthine dehydrogenase family protein molybdopterin-binding subunit [Syntrophorhabdales bacterium]
MKSISRRDFLKGSALTIAISITPFGAKLLSAKEVGQAVFAPTAFFELTPDNIVTVIVPSSEMGQGIHTALAMLVAEELEADWSQIRVKQSPAANPYKNPLLGSQQTVASASIRGWYEPFRKAGAAGRMMLVKAAADTWKVVESECETVKGVVSHKKSGRKLAYGKLCEKAGKLPVPQNPPLKKESEFKYIGKPMARLDIPGKVAGKAIYGLDVNVPDMLTAVIARPPAYGAKPISFDEQAAMGVKGVRKVAPTPSGIAVVADSTAVALKGREALKVQWDKGSHPDMNSESVERDYMEGLDKKGTVVTNIGDANKALQEAAKRVKSVYYVPFIAHACMEPMDCTAYVQKDRCDLWIPNQGQTNMVMAGAAICKLPPESIHVNTTLLGCGFGRKSWPTFAIEAMLASKAAGKPVKVVWTREDDLKHDFYRAATCQRLEAALDSEGRITGVSQKISCTSIMKFSPPGFKGGVDIYSLWGVFDNPNSPQLSRTLYEFPNWYLEQYLSDLPIPASPWRSVSNAGNAFVMECFIDELAKAAGKDPLAYRLDLLKNNMRATRVLQTVAEKGGWGKPLPQGMGRGIAQHSCFGAYLAAIADISVNDKDGKIKVQKITVAVDCGPVVNPDTVVAQVEGCAVMGCSTALKERIEFANGGVKTANFDDYKLLRMSEVPEIEVHIIKSTDRIGGLGEPPVTVVAPAIANALFNLTGARIRRLPLDPKTVMEALKNKGA